MLYIVAGVTASGKSAFAINLAEEVRGEIINGDSAQQYRGLGILTSQPNAYDCAMHPHHGYGRLALDDVSDVAAWLKYTQEKIAWLGAIDRPAIICGGSGLYIESLLYGLGDIPKSDPVYLRRLEKWETPRLKRVSERIHRDHRDRCRCDRQRLIRSLALRLKTGRGLAEWQDSSRRGDRALSDYRMVVFLPNRTQLRDVVRKRILRMLGDGVLDEIARTGAIIANTDCRRLKVCGLTPLGELVKGNLSRDEAIEKAVVETMQYAKRQSTWFRNREAKSHLFYRFSDDVGAEAKAYMLD